MGFNVGDLVRIEARFSTLYSETSVIQARGTLYDDGRGIYLLSDGLWYGEALLVKVNQRYQ